MLRAAHRLLFCAQPAGPRPTFWNRLNIIPAELAVAEKMRGLKLANVRVINLLGGGDGDQLGKKPEVTA